MALHCPEAGFVYKCGTSCCSSCKSSLPRSNVSARGQPQLSMSAIVKFDRTQLINNASVIFECPRQREFVLQGCAFSRPLRAVRGSLPRCHCLPDAQRVLFGFASHYLRAQATCQLLAVARKLTTFREMLLWMTPSEAPKALQASECSELLDPMRASC